MQKPLLLLFGTLLLITTSCKKYDDGGITINAKNKITKHDWIIDTSFLQDKSANQNYNRYVFLNSTFSYSFKSNGDIIVNTIKPDTSYSYKIGFWELKNKNKTLKIIYFNDSLFHYSLSDGVSIYENDSISKIDILTDSNYIIGFTVTSEYPIIKLDKNNLWYEMTIPKYIVGEIVPKKLIKEIHLTKN